MSSNLKVNTILPSTGTAIGIGTASGNINVFGHILGHNTPNISGINSVTASHFYGDGSQLSGIDASSIKFGGATKAQANAAGVVVTGILTATSFKGDGSGLTGLITPLSNRNLIINGAMLVDQRGDYSTTNSNASRQYGGPDRFHQYYYQSDESARYTFKQGGSGVSPVDKGFSNVAHLDVTTAQATVDITAGQSIWTGYRMEGYDCAHLKYGHSDAESVTLSFWIKSSVIGIYTILLGHTNDDERYVTTYTVNSADTWEKKTITIPGDTRSGKTISPSNGRGLELKWVWLAGSSRLATPNAWATQGNKYGASGVTLANIFSSTSNNLYLTGVQLEVGDTPTSFEHRSHADELARCQRYFTFVPSGTVFPGRGNSGSSYIYSYQAPVPMRASPTIGVSNDLAHGTFGVRRYRDNTGISDSTSTPTTSSTYFSPNSNMIHLVQGGFSGADDRSATLFVSGGAITIDAEL